MRNQILWGVPLWYGGVGEIMIEMEEKMRTKRPLMVATVNPEHMMKAAEDEKYKKLLQETDINTVDGIGLVWARTPNLLTAFRILRGKYREELATGVDLMKEIVKKANQKNEKVFLLGGFGEVARKTAENLKIKNFCWSSGEPKVSNDEVMKEINDYEPDYLLVAYGMKRQEEWIKGNLAKLKVGMAMGVGRSFDYYSGELKRAPEWVRRMGLEWLYSLIREPKRWRRQLKLIDFVIRILREA